MGIFPDKLTILHVSLVHGWRGGHAQVLALATGQRTR